MPSIIDKYLIQIRDIADTSAIYAYRGQRDANWQLQSGATRRLIEEHGDYIINDPTFPDLYIRYHRDMLLEPARARGYDVDAGRRLTDLELLAKLQHLGAPTGLLDFSWSPLVALWFACAEIDVDGKLFMVNMNDAVRVVRLNNDLAAEGLTAVLGELGTPPRIFYWEPSVTGEAAHRIIRQRSVFVIGGPKGLDGDPITFRITIPESDKEQILAELALLDYDHETMFFDVHGFAQASRWRRVPDLTADVHVRRANRFYQQEDFEQAISHYNQAMQLAPGNALTFFLRGNALAGCGRHNEAVADYDEVVGRVNPMDLIDLSVVCFNRGNSKAELFDREGAILDYTQAIDIRPDRPEYYYNRGNMQLDLTNFAEAIDDYDKVAGRSAGHAAFNKGNAFLSLGRLDEASTSYSIAGELGTDHAAVHQNRWALGEIAQFIDTTRFEVDPSTKRGENRITLQFLALDEGKRSKLETSHFLIYGRAGNVGNIGGPGLQGGTGTLGEPLTIVEINIRSEAVD